MDSKFTILKKGAIAFVGLAIVVSAVNSVPASAQYNRDRRDRDRPDMNMVWAGAGGSMLWFVVAGGSQPEQAGVTSVGGSKSTQSCTTIWHGQVTPCNGFSP